MSLVLEVVGDKAARMGGAVRKTFTAGGTIGRLADNDWVLPDEYISGHHAKISFTGGAFFIEDTSTNGVFVNSQQNRLPRGKPHPLRNGDTIFIDDYEVRVALAGEPVAAPSYKPASPAAFDAAPGSAGAPNATDPLALLGLQTTRPFAAGPSAASLQNSSVLSQHYQPPSVTPPPPPPVAAKPAGPGFIPDDYDPMGEEDDPFGGPPLAPPRPTAAAVPPAPAPVPAQRSAPRPAAAPPPTPVPPASAAASTVLTGPVRPKPGIRSPSEMRGPPPPKPGRRPIPEPGPAPSPGADPFDAAAPSARPSATGVGQGPLPMPPPRPSAAAAQKVRPPAKEAAPSAAPAPNTPAPSTDAPNVAALDFASLLQAAGIESMRITPELSQQFGKILRVVVAGLMDVLRARDKIKDEFRMRMTTFKQTDNNPLKFSANVEDALHNLLVKRNAAYLGPVEAFEDAFLDVRNHQMAMLAGVRVAYEAMLEEFDPERLQQDFEPQAKGANFLSGGAKAKYWELYRNRFHDMVKDADSSFRNLFGDEFAKAYEDQLARLKAANRAARK